VLRIIGVMLLLIMVRFTAFCIEEAMLKPVKELKPEPVAEGEVYYDEDGGNCEDIFLLGEDEGYCKDFINAKKEKRREKVITAVESAYNLVYSRIEGCGGEIKCIESFKKGLIWSGDRIGLTREQLIDRIPDALKGIESDPEKWPDLLMEKGRRIMILLYAMSLYGNPEAISAIEKILYSNKYQNYKGWAARTLLKSPTPWYPVADYVMTCGNLYMRYSLYDVDLKTWVLEYRKANDATRDSTIKMVCQGIEREEGPGVVRSADGFLREQCGEEYSLSKERFFIIKQKLESKDIYEYVKKYKPQKSSIAILADTLQKTAQNNPLHSSSRFRKYFNITEDLDTVDVFIHRNEPEEKK